MEIIKIFVLETIDSPPVNDWGQWSTWGKCSASCGNEGNRQRNRTCSSGLPGSAQCPGVTQEQQVMLGSFLSKKTFYLIPKNFTVSWRKSIFSVFYYPPRCNALKKYFINMFACNFILMNAKIDLIIASTKLSLHYFCNRFSLRNNITHCI